MLAFLGLVAFASYEYATLPDAAPLLKQNPKTTALIEQRADEAREAGRKPRRRQQWVPLSAISKPAVDAVLLSEDASFYLHDGVDTVELAQRAGGRRWRRGSWGGARPRSRSSWRRTSGCPRTAACCARRRS